LTLDLKYLAGQGAFVPGKRGMIRWPWSGASVGFEVRPVEGGQLLLILRYGVRNWSSLILGLTSNETVVALAIRLETTPTPWGNMRWRGRCPLVRDGQPCNRRLLLLHRPDGARYFGCRVCHRLSYNSSQMSHRRGFIPEFVGLTKALGYYRFARHMTCIPDPDQGPQSQAPVVS
jgi:hypothetical protein